MPDRIARMWNGSAWEIITSTAAAPSAVANYQSTAPSSPVTGQVWIDSDDRILYTWNGSSWVSSPNLSSYAPLASPTFTGTTTTADSVVSGLLTVSETTEVLNTGTISTNVFAANFATGGVFYITTAPAANFTINVTNLPTTDNRVTVVSFFVIQGATGYIPNALQIGGSAQTIKWSGGTAPTATNGAGKVDNFTFTFIRRGAAWEALGTSNRNF